MAARVRSRAFVKALFGLSAYVALQAVDGSRAGATCGDWLAHSAGDVAMTAGHADSHPSHSNAESRETRTGRSTLPFCPCRGPQCRQAPLQSTPPTPVVTSFRVEQLAVVSSHESQSDGRRLFLAGSESDVRPARGYPQRIDHPPRA